MLFIKLWNVHKLYLIVINKLTFDIHFFNVNLRKQPIETLNSKQAGIIINKS